MVASRPGSSTSNTTGRFDEVRYGVMNVIISESRGTNAACTAGNPGASKRTEKLLTSFDSTVFSKLSRTASENIAVEPEKTCFNHVYILHIILKIQDLLS